MNWDRRDRVFLMGAPIAAIPAVAFLPLFVYVFLQLPSISSSSQSSPSHPLVSVLAFSILVFAEILGLILVGFAGFQAKFGYVTFLATALSVLVGVVSAYTGLFFAIFADR